MKTLRKGPSEDSTGEKGASVESGNPAESQKNLGQWLKVKI